MALTRPLVETKAQEYADEEPLFPVEDEQISGLPGAFSSGEFGWRDLEWVVRWYYRRHLGAFPDDRRRAIEGAFGENDYEAVSGALAAAHAASDPAGAVEALTALSGVDVGAASAFLMFLDPASYVVVGDREWAALREAGELADPMPEPLTVDAYASYLETCRNLTDRLDCSLWTLYRALWRLWTDEMG